MSLCTACNATFSALDLPSFSKDRAACIDKEQPHCRCEDVSVSVYSSGPVENHETLIRILVAPQHMNRKRKPKSAALTDAKRGGLSMFREDQVTNEQIRIVAEGLVTRARKSDASAGVFGSSSHSTM